MFGSKSLCSFHAVDIKVFMQTSQDYGIRLPLTILGEVVRKRTRMPRHPKSTDHIMLRVLSPAWIKHICLSIFVDNANHI